MYSKEWYEKNKEKVAAQQKDFNITSYLRHYNKIPERIYREVEKCILLCSNCHRLEHSDEY